MINREEIENALNKLGDDPNIMAKELEKLGITGYPGKIESCPIANYLNSCFKDNVFYIKAEYILTSHKDNPLEENKIITPGYVERFISRFDRGVYPKIDNNHIEKFI